MQAKSPKICQVLDILQNVNIEYTPETTSRATKVNFNYLYFTGYNTEFKFSISNNILYVYEFINRKPF